LHSTIDIPIIIEDHGEQDYAAIMIPSMITEPVNAKIKVEQQSDTLNYSKPSPVKVAPGNKFRYVSLYA